MDREEQRKRALETVRGHLVAVILAVRRQYLAGGGGALKHWEQLQTRLRSAAMTTGSVQELVSSFLRGMRIEAPDKRTSLTAHDLMLCLAAHSSAHQLIDDDDVLDLIEREIGLLIAMARVRAGEKQAEQSAAQER